MTRTAAPPTRPPEPDGPRQVSKFEFNLLRILRFMVGHFPAGPGHATRPAPPSPRPECLSGRGGRSGARTRSPRRACCSSSGKAAGGTTGTSARTCPTPGRVWERIPLDERCAEFSRPRAGVPDLGDGGEGERDEDRVGRRPESPERRPTNCSSGWPSTRSGPTRTCSPRCRKKDAFRLNPLCWISFPGDMTDDDEPTPPELRPALRGAARRAAGVPPDAPHAPVDSIGADEGADRRLEADAATGAGGVRRPAGRS